MINHMNLPNQGQPTRASSQQSVYIAFVNNKDEAMMLNVPKGYTFYIFELYKPVFYMKTSDVVSGQISFSEYEYNEIIPQPAPDPSNFVTREDMNSFKDDIMSSIAALLTQNNQKEGVSNGQHIPKPNAKPVKPVKN